MAQSGKRAAGVATGLFERGKRAHHRVRIIGSQAWLTLKGYISDMTRSEFEYEIPLAHAQAMMADMCPFKMEKYRYHVEFEGFVYEIDEYFGDNAPLIVVEIELPSEDTEFPKPSWLGKESRQTVNSPMRI